MKEGCKITQKELKDLNFPHAAIIGGVIRKGAGHIVMGDFEFEPKDRVVVLSAQEDIKKVEAFFQ